MRNLLPALQGLSLLCLLFAAITAVPVQSPWASTPLVAAVYGAAAPVVAGLWLWRATIASGRGRAVVSALVALALIPVAVLGSVGFTIPVLLTAVALMVVDSGRIWGYATALVVAVAGTALHLRSGNGLLTGVANSVPVMVLLGFGIALGSALRAYEDAHARDRRTIDERDDALHRLEEAITRLRRTSEVEKELLLADERARSARELHDGLGHRLTLISMSLEYARRARAEDPEGAWQEVGTADGTAREALAEMRTWVRALSPVRDTEATGVAAFDAIAESFRGTGLEVTVETSGPDLCLGEDASLLFYRTVQEGLTNALRHGPARRARITLITDADGVALRIVSDLDGDAVTRSDDAEVTPGFGLRGLTDRASTLGGSAHAARRGADFELTVRIPRDRAVDPASCERAVPA